MAMEEPKTLTYSLTFATTSVQESLGPLNKQLFVLWVPQQYHPYHQRS